MHGPAKTLTIDKALRLYESDLEARDALVYTARHSRRHLTPSLLCKPLTSITEHDLKSWRNSLAKTKLAGSTVNRIMNGLRAALELADKSRTHIWRARLEKLPDAQTARNVVLSDPEVLAFVAAAYRHDRGLGLLADVLAITGTRPSQAPQKLLALQEVLDELLAAGLVEIKGMRDGRPVYLATDKARKRTVHISEPPKAIQ